MSRLFLAAVMLAFLVCSFQPVAAEDDAATPQGASPLESLKPEDLVESTTPEDPYAYLRSFQKWLREHERPPPRTRNDTALYDIWRAALRPRASRMRMRIDKLLRRGNWLPETGAPERVKPAAWAMFIREVAALTTELTGAWNQYKRARIKIKRGIPAERVRPVGHYYGYAHPAIVWRRGLLARGAIVRTRVGTSGGLVIGGSTRVGGVRIGGTVRIGVPRPSPLVLTSYWNLMRRYRLGWGWRLEHCATCEARREAEQAARKKLKDYIAQRQALFDSTTHTLEQQILSTRLLIAAMQAQEEHYLAEELATLGDTEDVLRANAAALQFLADKRLAAEQYDGDSAAAYGQLLRQWTRGHTKAVKDLQKN
ncbi:MAG: hypothetical protein QNJ90_02115 [Planctomycetota bacterium]|nr:hypothetical protein [Planctomycetota bacterium]